MSDLKLLFLGDVVGSSGRAVIAEHLPQLRADFQIDLVVANAENSAHGFGLTPTVAQELFSAGCDVLTGGNHSFDKKEINQCFQEHPTKILRPANYPSGTTGRGSSLVTTRSGKTVGVINLMGRIFMEPLDCPFQTFDKEFDSLRHQTKVILVDIHAEASSEKQAMGFHCDGRASCIVGTHTHVPTADERILPKGSGFLTDAGMNGAYDSVIGMKKEIILDRFLKRQHIRMEVADGPGTLSGVLFHIDSTSGRCEKVERIRREARR
jgi:metallophosphoesterase (TIGR00282 family)